MSTYNNPWLFNNKPFEDDDIGKFHGFVYLITNKLNGKRYIGRKYFYSIRKVSKVKRRKRFDSDWKTYYSSCDELIADVKELGEENFERRILSLHTTRGDCNYEEVKQQFLNNILESDGWYNLNINGKWHRKNVSIMESRVYDERGIK